MEELTEMSHKRELKPTEKAKEERLHRLNGLRRAKLGQLTKKVNELKRLKENDSNVDKVEEEILNDFAKLYGEFNDINKEFVTLLPEEEASEDQQHWFNPKSANIEQFVRITEKWIKGVREGTKEDHEEEACSSEDDIRPEDSASRASNHTVVSLLFLLLAGGRRLKRRCC